MSENGGKYEIEKNATAVKRVKNSWKRENHIQISTLEEGRGIGWQKVGIWRLKGMTGNTDHYGLYVGRRRD
jgi:hypothetical protein